VTVGEAAIATLVRLFRDSAPKQVIGTAGGKYTADELVVALQGEAVDIWCSETTALKPLLKCIVSIGLKTLTKRPIEICQAEDQASKVADERHFRFHINPVQFNPGVVESPQQALAKVASEHVEEQRSSMRYCVLSLTAKQSA
jgi:hypothetical protein